MPAFDASAPWALSDQVSLRDEEFGALAYHYGTRRLVFLKSRRLVEVATSLSRYDTAAGALTDLVGPEERPAYERALSSLAASGVLVERR
ncbi:MAG TPA: mycofactocin biosynthesis chaperone MftB [Acidimicrobiales bacterium]|nr:mycofactocin biosynthesis chaperone MftB [Acidimicrobiales bacterium]